MHCKSTLTKQTGQEKPPQRVQEMGSILTQAPGAPEGPRFLVSSWVGWTQGIHRAWPEGMVAGLPVPSFLAVSLKVFPGPSVHPEFQLKLWLGILCV